MATTPKALKPDLASLRIQDTKRTSPGSGKRWVWIVLAVIVLVLIAAALAMVLLLGFKIAFPLGTAVSGIAGGA